MQGDDLVADDVCSSLQVARDGGGGGEVVGNELVSDPGVATDDGALADLGPLKASGSSPAYQRRKSPFNYSSIPAP